MKSRTKAYFKVFLEVRVDKNLSDELDFHCLHLLTAENCIAYYTVHLFQYF